MPDAEEAAHASGFIATHWKDAINNHDEKVTRKSLAPIRYVKR